jgi:hypothetical protein
MLRATVLPIFGGIVFVLATAGGFSPSEAASCRSHWQYNIRKLISS